MSYVYFKLNNGNVKILRIQKNKYCTVLLKIYFLILNTTYFHYFSNAWYADNQNAIIMSINV